MIHDHLDEELLPVFIEEAKELLARIGDGLMKLKDAPGSASLLAALRGPIHTIKGSARMTGAMEFGAHWHACESKIATLLKQANVSADDVVSLLDDYDRGLQLFRLLQHPEGKHPATTSPVQATAPGQDKTTDKKTKKPPPPVAYVRIRANVLDQFLNQAGETSIAGSHVGNGAEQLQAITQELGENINRVEKQVRQAGMQAEIHMQSLHAKGNAHADFDPLELDRFTQLQELARMLEEGLGDIAVLQKNLAKVVGTVRESAAKSARLTRALQKDIMAARMVPFKSIHDRLQRLIRQASREVDKEVRLDVLGAHQAIDRSVLEKMVVVLEHLLRNAIAHGIEHRLVRLDQGKSAHGKVQVEVKTEANELMIRVADDGQGMDMARIKARAVHHGLLAASEELSVDHLFGLISHPGLSTSDKVTSLSGRGVGLDVVRAEIIALGGRVEMHTQARKGTRFDIYLPMTLAVTQVVLLRLGATTYAIPSQFVEQVLHPGDANHPAQSGRSTYQWQGRDVPVTYLANLLQLNGDVQYAHAAVMLKHGRQRMVVLVDAVLGNKEVVTKNVGVQLARVDGILGVTILGSGEIVLILHPAVLIQRKGLASVLPEARPAVQADQPHVVMVVDDSITVRRVLHKCLTREGYDVVLAKDGMDALLQLQKTVPDIILLDIEMPRMDGFHLLGVLRERADTAAVPVVMMTSRTARKHKDRALALGANAYLGKPYQEDVLLATIAGYIDTHKA